MPYIPIAFHYSGTSLSQVQTDLEQANTNFQILANAFVGNTPDSGTVLLSQFSLNSGTSAYALNSETSAYALNSGTSAYALNSGTSVYALNSETSAYALNSGTSAYATHSGTSNYSLTSATALVSLSTLSGGSGGSSFGGLLPSGNLYYVDNADSLTVGAQLNAPSYVYNPTTGSMTFYSSTTVDSGTVIYAGLYVAQDPSYNAGLLYYPNLGTEIASSQAFSGTTGALVFNSFTVVPIITNIISVFSSPSDTIYPMYLLPNTGLYAVQIGSISGEIGAPYVLIAPYSRYEFLVTSFEGIGSNTTFSVTYVITTPSGTYNSFTFVNSSDTMFGTLVIDQFSTAYMNGIIYSSGTSFTPFQAGLFFPWNSTPVFLGGQFLYLKRVY